MNHRPNRFLSAIAKRPLVSLLVLLLLLVAGMTLAYQQSRRMALERIALTFDRSSAAQKNLLQRATQNALMVPEVMAATPHVRMLLARPGAAVAAELNEMLEETARNTGMDVIYVMDAGGNTLAASNWREPDSFVGKNYRFRPYFREAITGRTGRYIAKGVTSQKLGYYLARPVMIDGRVAGVVVVKLSFDALQSQIETLWRDHQELALVTDAHGVVVVSPIRAWVMRLIHPLAEAERKAIEASRQYGEGLSPVELTPGAAPGGELRFVAFSDVPDRSFLQQSHALPELGLRLVLHLPAARYWEMVAEFTGMFSLAALVVFLICIAAYQRWTYGVKLIEAAIRDPLTGLNTRLYMGDWCAAAISAHARDPGAGFGLAIFDLDFFKQVNDRHGHLAGDEVLRRVGAIIRHAIRGQDLAVRFGGEELAVFLRCADAAETAALAERIRRSVEQAEFPGETGKIAVTLSGGVAYHAVGETLDALFARADKKLYEAKELGRNRIRH